METFEEPLVTCDAVLSEAFFLLKRHADRGSEELMEMIRRGLVRSMFSFSEKEDRILSIMKKYAKLPTSFADLCLVAMAEQFKNAKVWTLDSDFRIYRKIDRRLIPLISPY
jgi:predicted nucleic acid-binding protein